MGKELRKPVLPDDRKSAVYMKTCVCMGSLEVLEMNAHAGKGFIIPHILFGIACMGAPYMKVTFLRCGWKDEQGKRIKRFSSQTNKNSFKLPSDESEIKAVAVHGGFADSIFDIAGKFRYSIAIDSMDHL